MMAATFSNCPAVASELPPNFTTMGPIIKLLSFVLFCQRAFKHGGVQRRRGDGSADIR